MTRRAWIRLITTLLLRVTQHNAINGHHPKAIALRYNT
jgi:hypothetical protein